MIAGKQKARQAGQLINTLDRLFVFLTLIEGPSLPIKGSAYYLVKSGIKYNTVFTQGNLCRLVKSRIFYTTGRVILAAQVTPKPSSG